MFISKSKFFVIEFESVFFATGYFNSYNDALKYVEYLNEIHKINLEDEPSFTISEYDSEEDYYNNI